MTSFQFRSRFSSDINRFTLVFLVLLLSAGLILFEPVTFAESMATTQPIIGTPSDLIGVAAAVRGTVELSREGIVGKKIGSGENIYLGDKITTDAKGRLQILLLDETVFTIGPNSAMAIDTFVYDPKTNDGEIKAKIVKGTFRFVTGKIGHKKPSQMTVDLPAGSIGIRGTIVAGQTDGNHSFVMLMGPGEGNNTGNNAGAFTLSNTVNGETQEVLVNRSGYGSIIEGDGSAPLPPFQVSQDQTSALINSFSPPPSNSAGGRLQGGGPNNASQNTLGNIGSASDVSGENTIGALSSANDFESLTESINQLTAESSPASQNTLTTTSGSNTSGNTNNDGGSTSYYYSGSNFDLSGDIVGSGKYKFYLEITPGEGGSFGGTNSYVKNDGYCTMGNTTDVVFDFHIPETILSQGQTSYTFDYNLVDQDASETEPPGGLVNREKITFEFSSDPTVGIPATVKHIVTVDCPAVGNYSPPIDNSPDGATTNYSENPGVVG